MATEAETPEPVSLTKIVGENIYLEKEQSECRVEKGEMQVATGPEAMNTTIEANVETAEGERFLESSSGVEVSCTDTYNESKQMVDNVKTEAADESGKGGSEIMEESEEKPEKNDKSHAIESLTGSSLRMAEIEEPDFTRQGVSEEWSIGSHSEVITDQDVPVEDKSLEKETGQVHHNEEVIGIPETKLDHEGEASIRVPDLTVASFNKDGTGEAFTQSIAVRPDIQSDEEATSKIKEGDEEIVHKPYATSATEASSIHEAELKENIEVNEKITKDKCISDEDICGEGSTFFVTKDNTGDTETINALEHSQSGMSSHEPRPENLQQNKPEEEKLERALSVVDKDFIVAALTEHAETIEEEAYIENQDGRYEERIIDALEHSQSETSYHEEKPENSSIDVSTESAETRTSVEGQIPFKSQEESFEKIIKEDLSIHTDADSKNEIPEDKDIPQIELNEKTEGAEVEVPNENATDIHDPHPLIEVAKQTEEINLDKVSSIEPEGRAQEVNEASTEEKYIKDPPEPYQSQNMTIVEHPSTEEEVKTELTPRTNETDIKELHVPELESEEKSVIKANIAAEKSEEENNTEQIIELESVEQVSVKSLEDEEKKAEEVTGEISDNFKTERAAESIGHEASKTTESPQEIPDTCQVKEEESLQEEEKNLTATESSLEEKIEKNEPEEKLEQPLHLITETNETFSSEANETPCQMEEGATETLKEAPQKEETEKETEENNDTEGNKTAIEEDLQMLVETSNASESIETTTLEPTTEFSNVVAEDDIKMEDTKELLESCKDTGKNEEAEKWSIVTSTESAETRTSVQGGTPFKGQEESFEKIIREDLPIHTDTDSKNEISEDKDVPEMELNEKIEGAEVEVPNENVNDICDPHPLIEVAKKTEEINLDKVSSFEPEGRTQEVNDASTEEKYIEDPPEPYQSRDMTIVEHPSIEGEVNTPQTNETDATELESEEKSVIKGNTTPEKSEEESNIEQVIELESVEQVSVKSLEDEERKAEEVTGEISENFETDRATESIEHEASKTTESPQEIPDTCQVKEEESLQEEEKNLTATESSLEEKIEKNEPEEKLEQPLHLITETNETFSSEANETPCQMEEGATETLKEAPQKEETEKETEENNDTEGNKTAIEEDLQMLVETSNASESIETTTLEPTTEFSNVVAEDDIKMEDTKELLESCKDTGKNEEAEKWSIVTSTESAETRTSVQGGTPFKGQEESFEKIIREDLPIHTDTDSKNEISEDKDVPEMELNEKIEGAEVEVPNENVNDIRDPHPLIEVAKKTEEINLDKVSSFEPKGRTQEVNEASTEEKYIEDPPEPYQSQDMTIVEHPSIEGEVNTPQTNETDATELESEEKSVIKGNTTPEKSEEESNIEQVIELESVEQVSVKSLEDEERKAEEVTGEISENFETDRAAESIEHEASKTTESPQEIPDTCQVKEEESLQKEEKNLTATESSLEEKIEKNEPEEKLEQPLHLITEKNETPCQMEEGATETLKEAPQKEETEKETEENNDTEGNKTAIEEDLQMLVETSNASESIETTTLEPKTEFSNVVAEDDIKMEDTKELLESYKDTGKNEEAEKWSIVTSTESAEARTSVQGGTPFKGQEESFEKIIREDLPIHTDTESKNEISEDKDVPEMELNEKIEDAEVEVPNENVNDIRDPHPLIEVAKKTEEINLDKVSSFEPEGRTQEVNDASTEEKYTEDPPEPYQSRDVTIVEHPSIEGEVNTPQTNETDATELESEEKSVIKGNTTPEKSEEESNIEQVVELESVEQVSVKSLEDEERKAGEISENFETDRAAESVEHEASKTTESPQEIPDTCQAKEEESLQKEENLTATEASLEEKLEKNEPEEKLEQPLHLITEKNETFSSEANETPCQMEEGATEILKKALQKEETEIETEENNDIEGSKIAIEEDLQMPVETSNASGSIETTVLEPKTEISNMVAEDDIKMEDTKELLESCKDTGKDEEADKHERKEECVTIPEAFEEKTVQCSEEDKKEEEESRGLEVEKIEQSSEEGHAVTNISSELTEQETAVIHPGDTNEVKKPEGENNLKQIVEETNVRDFIPQSVDQVLVKNLENEEKEAKDFTGKYFESETEKTTESIVNETCKTIESPREIPDTFQVKQGESLQREAKNETVTESSPEEKSLESELTEKLEKPLSSDSNENEAFVSNSNEVHSLKEEGSPQNREEAPETEENEKETEFQSDTKDYNITLEKDDQVDVEISDTSKSIESTILESKAEMENLVVEDDMKKEESKEICEEFKDAGEVEETQRHDITEECTTIPAPIGENTVQSSEDDKKEETPKVQACAQHETISLGEDDEKQTQNEENILDRTGELEAEKTEQSSKDDHIVPPILSKSIQHETAETYPGNANEADNPGEEDKQTVEENNIRDCIPESVEQISVKNLKDEENKAEEPTREGFEKSKTEETTENETCETTESPREILDTFQVKQEESSETKELNVTATEPSQVEEPQKNKPEEKTEKPLSSMSYRSEAFNSDAEKLPCQIDEGAPQNLEEAPHEEEHEKETEDNKISMEKDNQAAIETSDPSKSTERTILESRTKMDKMVDEDGTGKEQSEELCEEKESVVEQSREVEVEKTELRSTEEHAIANMSLESIDREAVVISSGNEIKAEESEGKNDVIIEESNIGSLIPEIVEQVSLNKVEDEEKKEHESTGEILDSPKTKEVVDRTKLETGETLESPREILDTFQEKHGESLQSEEDLTTVESSQNLEETPQKQEKENVTEVNNNIEENRIAVEESLQEVAGTSDANTTTESTVPELQTEKDNMVVEDDVKKEESKESYEKSKDAEVEKHEMVEECVNTDILQEITGENSLKSPGADKKEEETSKIELEETGVVKEGADRSRSSECTNILKEPCGEKVHQSSGDDKKEEETSKTEVNSAGEDAEEQFVKEEIMVDQSREEVEKVEQKNKPEEKTESPYSSMSDKNEAFNSDSEKLPCQKEEGAPQNVEEASHEEENEKETDDIKIAMEEDNQAVFETSDTSKITERTILEPKTEMDRMVDEDDTGKEQSKELCKDKDVEVAEEKENIVEQSREAEVEKTELSSVEEHAIANMEDEEKKDNESTGEILDRLKTEEVVDNTELETSKTSERPKEILDTFQEKNGESLQSEEKELTTVESSQNLEEAPQKEEKENITEGKNDIEENRITVEESFQEVAGTSDANKTAESVVLELKTEKDDMVVEEDVKEESKEFYRISNDAETEKHDMVEECVNMDTLQETTGEKSLQSSGVDIKEEETSKIELEETGVVPGAETQTPKGGIDDQSTEFEAQKSEESFKEDYTFGYILPESIEQETVEISPVSVNKKEKSEGKNNAVQVVEDSNITDLIPESVEQVPVKNLEEEEKKADMPIEEISDNIKVEEATQSIENETDKNRSMEIPRESLDTFRVKLGESLPSEEKNLTTTKESPPGPQIEELLSDSGKIPCLMEDGASQTEGTLMTAEKENETEDNNQSKDKKIPKEEDPEVVGETSDTSKSAESIVLELKSEMDNRIAEDDIKNEESQELCENFVNPAKVEEIEQRGVSTKEIVQSSEEDKKEEEIPQIEVSSYSEPNRVEKQSRDFEVEKTEQSFKEEHTIANILPQSIEQETAEIHEESENKAEESEGRDRIEQVVEESNIHITESSIEKNPQESEPEEKHEHLLPSTKSDKTEAFISENATMPCQMEEKVAQNLEEASQKEEHMKETDDNKDNKIEVQEEVQEGVGEKINQSSGDDKKEEETSKTGGKNVGEDAEEQSVKEEIMVEQSRGVEKVEQHFEEDNMESKMLIEETTGENSLQNHRADKKEEETSKIELEETGVAHDAETLTLKGDIVDQSTEFEAHKSEESFTEDYTLDYVSPELIEQKTVEISPVSVNEKEKSEGKNNVIQMVEQKNITDLIPESVEQVPVKNLEDEEKKAEMSTGEIADNIKVEEATQSIENETSKSRTMEIPIESLDTFQVKQGESLPSEEKNLTIANESLPELKIEESLSDGGKLPCLMEDEISQIEGAPMKTEKENETGDNNESEDKKIPKEKDLQVVAETSDASKSAESTTEDDIKNEESQELCENFVDAAKFEEIEQHDVPDECVSTKEIVQSSEEVKKEEEIPEIEVSSYSEPTRVEEQSREFEVEKTEQSFKEEHTVADISPPSIEQEATEIHEKSENKAEESEGKNIAEQEVEESNIDATESSIDKNPQESEPEEKLEHLLPSENDKMPCQMEEKAAQNLEEAPQKEEHMKETDDNKDDKIEAQEQEVQESADRSKSSDFTNISLESNEEKIHQSSRDDKNEEETSKTEASSVGEDAEVQSVKEEDDIESKMPTEESKRTQKVDEDVDAKKQNIEGDRAENNIEASETADFTTSREIQSIVDTKEGLISSTVEDDTVVERSLEDGRKAMKVDELSSAFVEEIEETSSAMEKVSETLKDSEKSNVNSSPREIGECLDEKSSLVPEASEEITEKEEKIIDDTDFASVMVAKEEICLTETEPEGEKQVECQATEKRENIKEDEVPDIRSEDKKDATSDKRPLEETPEEVESSTMTSKEHGIVTGEARETTNLSNVSEVGLVDTDKEPANEEVQKERFEDLYVHSELDKDNPLSVSEGVEISKEEESRELADRTDDCASKTLEDVESSISSSKPEKTEDNPFDEALKTTETYNICADTGKDVLEQEMIEDKEYVEVEKEVIEQKGEAESQRLEDEDTKYTAEEIVKSADRDQILQHPSEAGSGDGSYEMLPETDKNQIEENCSNIKKQEDENEKEEPKLEADDPKEQNANETKKAVILAEETLEGVEQSNDSEVTKEPVLQEEHGISEPHVLSIVGERTYEVLDSSPEYSEFTGTVDSRKKMETESSEVEESSITEREASFSGQSKEQKVEDGSIEPPAELEEKTEEITESSKNRNATFTTETEAIPREAQLHGRLVEDQGEPCSEKTEESSIREREASFAGQSKEQKVEDSSMEPPAELEEKIEEITESSKSHSATLATEAEAVPGEAQLHGRLVEGQGEPCSEKTEESSIREREVSFAGQSKEQKVEDSSIEPPAALEEKIEEITESSKSQNATLKTETEAVPGEAQLHGRLVEDQGEPCSEKTEESSIREREASSAGQSKQQKVEDSSFEPPAELEEKIEEITESSKSHHGTLTAETEAIPGEAQLHGRLVEYQGEPCSEKTEIEYALQGKEVNSMKIEETSSDLTPELQTVEYIVTEEPDETKRASEPFHESKEGTEETELEKCPTVKSLDQFTANDLIHAEKKNEAPFSVVYETQDVGAEGTAKTGESQTIVTTDQVPSTNSEDAEEDSPLVETPNADENEAKVVQEAICESKDQGIEDSGESTGVEKLDQVPATNSGDVMKGSVPEGNSEADEVVETEIASIIIPQSKEQGTNESDETGKSPTAEKPYTEKSEEACKETSDHGVIGEPCIEPIEKLDQVPATNSEDVMKGSVPEENSEADEVVETEIASKIVPLSKEQGTDESNETGKSPAAEETDKDKSEEACEETSEYGVFREQDKEPVEKLDQVPATYSGDVVKRSVPEEISEADGVVETDIASNIVAQSKEQGTNESDETGKSPTAEKPYTDKSEEACKETADHGVIGEPGIEPIEKLDQVPATNSEDVMKGNVPGENSEADEAVETEIASKIVPLSKEQGTDKSYEIGKSPTAEKPDTDESEEASDHGVIGEPDIEPVQKLDQVPATNSRDVIKGSVPEENSEADKVVETDIASNIVPQSKEQGTNESDETGKSPTASKPDTDKSGEACKETSDREVIGEPSFDPVAKGEITAEQTPPAEKLTEWILTQTSELPSEYGATTTVENIEEEKTEKMEKTDDDGLKDSSAAKLTEEISSLKKISRELDSSTVRLSTDKNREESPTEVHWEEGQTTDGDIHLEHQEDENKIKCLASSSASNDIIDVATETDKACDVNLETSERAFESIQESEFTDISAEETHSKKTSEANIITEKEVSKEEIKEEKEVAETYQPNSLSEEKLTEGLQEDEQMPGECTGQKTNLTFDTTVGGSLAEELPMVNEKATASKTIIEQVVAEDRSPEHPDRVSVEDKKIKESFPNKFEEINVEESAIKVDSINQDSSENDRTVIAEESSEAILQKENFEGFEKGGKETQKSEETSFVTSEKQVTREECPDTTASTGNEQHVPPVLSEGILETSRDVETEDFTKVVHSEAKEDKHGEEISEESTLVDSNKASLQKLFEKSTRERTQVDEDVKKERDPTGGKEEMQTEEAESHEEEGDEHKKTDSGSDAPVMVEASREMEVKAVTHKKSLLSGVGSKVKHSISKVKKAITGKSTHHHHSKPMSPK